MKSSKYIFFSYPNRAELEYSTRDLEMREWQWQGKCRLKSEFTVFQSSSGFFQLALSNKCELSWSWIPKSLIQVQKEKESSLLLSYVLHKPEIRHFHVVVVHKKSKEMYEKVWCKCKVVVLLIKPIDFLTFWLPSPSSDLKVPTVEDWLDRLRSALKHFPILI